MYVFQTDGVRESERGQRERGAASPSQGAHLSISLAQSIRLPGAAALPIFLWSEPTICTKLQAGVEGGRAAGGASERELASAKRGCTCCLALFGYVV